MNPTLDTGEEKADRAAADGLVRASKLPESSSATEDMPEQENDKTRNIDDRSARDPVKFFGIRVPHAVEASIYKVQDLWQNLRVQLVPVLPKTVINSSAKIIGVMQLTAEMLMLKSAGATFVPDKSRWVNYIIQPPKVVYDTIFKKAQGGQSLSQSLNPGNLVENIKAFTNLEKAASLDSLNHTIPLINRWQARSALGGILAGLASSAMPDVKESHEEVEAKAIMQRNNPVGYFFKCLGQALWFPAETVIDVAKKIADPKSDQKIGEHKRQFAGLTLLGAGLSSIVSGFRQVGGDFDKTKKVMQEYRRNPWHIAGGIITSIAGNFLMTGINNQQGWGNFGSTQMARTLILYPSISSRFKAGLNGKLEDNRWWYAGGQSIFQVKNVFASLVGGSEVKDDGTIDYHVDEKREAISTAKHNKMLRNAEKADHKGQHQEYSAALSDGHGHKTNNGATDAPPTTRVSGGGIVQHAMPQRLEAKHKEMAEVIV